MSVVTNAPIASGTYTSDGVSQRIALQQGISRFEVYSLTKYNLTVAPVGAELYMASWIAGMSPGFASIRKNTAGAFTPFVDSVIQANGFSLFNDVSPQTFAPAALAAATSISKAASAVVTSAAAHGLATGDVVRIYGVATLNTLNGLLFRVTVTAPTTFTIEVDTSAQTAVGAGGFFQKVIPPIEWQPEAKVITRISKAAAAVVTTSVPHGYSVGAQVRLNVPDNFGMIEANGQLVTITAVPTSTTFTTDLNSAAFTAFAFPQQIAAFASTFAQAVPVGESVLTGSFNSSTTNNAQKGILLGSSVVGASADSMYWVAYSGLSI